LLDEADAGASVLTRTGFLLRAHSAPDDTLLFRR
jgi:hypothetical protein